MIHMENKEKVLTAGQARQMTESPYVLVEILRKIKENAVQGKNTLYYSFEGVENRCGILKELESLGYTVRCTRKEGCHVNNITLISW